MTVRSKTVTPRPVRYCMALLLPLAIIISPLAIIIWADRSSLALNAPVVIPQSAVETVSLYALLVSCSILVMSIVSLITRKLFFSIAVTSLLLFTIAFTSKIKYQYLQVKLLPTDIYFNATDPAQLSFFIEHYRDLSLFGIVFISGAILFLILVYRYDITRVSRAVALICGVLAFAVSEAVPRWLLPPTLATDVFWHSRLNDRHLSDFIMSSRSFLSIVNKPFSLGDRIVAAKIDLQSVATAPIGDARPNIIVILHESSVDPSLYFLGEQYKVQPEFFESGDGQRRRLRVETYGGRTWMSEYGLLLGVDINYFDSRASYLGILGAGKFKNALPEELGRMGYRTVANYPSPVTFLNTFGFYRSIGFESIMSPDDMGLYIELNDRPRDKQYYDFLLNDLARNRSNGDVRPTFYLVWTTATHYPYSFALAPEDRKDEISTDPDAEFARRQRLAADDLQWFEQKLAERFPDEKFLIAGFGDHHPVITYPYVADAPIGNTKRPRDPAEHWMRTYYRIDGVGFNPNYAALSPDIEIGFLGESILTAARLPVSQSYLVRRWLRGKCGDQWINCADTDAVAVANSLLSSGEASVFVDSAGNRRSTSRDLDTPSAAASH